MIVESRWYQEEAIDALFKYFFNSNGHPLVCLPTGSGKGFVIAKFIRLLYEQWPYLRVVNITHVKELIAQNHRKFMEVWPGAQAGIYSAGLKRKDVYAPITFAGRDSFINAVELFGKIDLLLIDECHLLGPNDDGNYMKIIAALMAKNPNMKIVGFTATAWRTGLGLLTNGGIFTDIVYDICNIPGFARLFGDNHLVRPRPVRAVEASMSGVDIVNGDYSQGQMAKRYDEKISWEALNESLTRGKDKQCRLIFCSGVERAVMTNEMCKSFGLRTEVVHSKMPESERDAIMLAYANGELDTLVNNGICTTGLDVQRIDHIIMLRATMSVGLWVQIVGRGMRPYETDGWRKTECLVSDHGGNAKRLGPIDDPYIPKMRKKEDGDAPVRICPACDSYNHASARVCVFCGEAFEFEVKFKKIAAVEELIRSEIPKYEWYNVQSVYYTSHEKKNKQPTDRPTLKALYVCGMHTFTEYKAFESPKLFVKKLARDWWKQRFPDAFVPETVDQALQYIDKIKNPKRVKVWVNKEFPSIESFEF